MTEERLAGGRYQHGGPQLPKLGQFPDQHDVLMGRLAEANPGIDDDVAPLDAALDGTIDAGPEVVEDIRDQVAVFNVFV